MKIITSELLLALPSLPDNHYDAVLCDPPYHLTQNSRNGSAQNAGRETPFGRHGIGSDNKGFMGHTWDGGDVAFQPDTWKAVIRVMKPGGYLMAFGGSRTYHRMAVALENAGFILIDTLMWLYGTGFPKSRNVAADIDKAHGGNGSRSGAPKKNVYDNAKRNPLLHGNPADQSNTGKWGLHSTPHGMPTVEIETPEGKLWDGYGTALKPAFEPIILCRKPGEKTYAENARKWGCGSLNINGARIPVDNEKLTGGNGRLLSHVRDGKDDPFTGAPVYKQSGDGRWPSNVILDDVATKLLNEQVNTKTVAAKLNDVSRFFYTAKVSPSERKAGVTNSNDHPTLKPIELTKYLATLLLPPVNDTKILIPFAGGGSEMIGARLAGWKHVTGIEQSDHYVNIAMERIAHWCK